MKISDVIKTPVEVEDKLMDGLFIRDSIHRRIAHVYIANSDIPAAIAHAINSHDKLVDLVGRMRALLVGIGDNGNAAGSYGEEPGCPYCYEPTIRVYEGDTFHTESTHKVDCLFAELLKESEGVI